MAPTIPGARQLVNPRPGLITIWYIYRVILANLQDVITMRERQRKEINKDLELKIWIRSSLWLSDKIKMKMNNLDSMESSLLSQKRKIFRKRMIKNSILF